MKYYVNIHASKDGCGTREMPFKHISDAALIALPGDEIIVAPGIYREHVKPENAGFKEKRIVYRSEKPLGAVITGSEPARDWKKCDNGLWVYKISNSVFGNYNPYTTYIRGDWYFAPVVRHTGAVYLNDRQLYEAETMDECIKGEIYPPSWEPEYSIYKWYTEQDSENNCTVIYANFHDIDPNKEQVEINVRRNCFMPEKNGVDYITVSGFHLNKAATTWAPPAAYQDGLIGPHWSKGWIIEDCEISNSKCCGISLGKYYDPENDHYFTNKHVKSPTQMERDAVCRGQYHGWLKEKIGHHIVRRCHIHHCEQTGIAGRQGCVFSLIEDNHIHHINNMQQLGGAEIAGIKLHAAIDVIIRRNHIHHSTMGIWCDWEAQGTRITQNLFHDNHAPSEDIPMAPGSMQSQDVFIEVGHGPTLIDNNISLSKVSFRLATQGVALVHNLALGALTSIGSGTDIPLSNGTLAVRYTPYHIPHRTEVAGFMTILHGDDRIYNNIFVQNWPVKESAKKEDMGFIMEDNQIAGTSVFNGYPTYEEWIEPFDLDGEANMFTMQELQYGHLPVWINGNAYLNGARPWDREKDNFTDDKTNAYARLEEKDGSYYLDTNIYDIISGFSVPIICTETLGKAFEPEQRFENPDGTDITFNRDYAGNERELSTLPGPFSTETDSKKPL